MNEYLQNVNTKIYNNEIINLLRSALADELIAAHNYWTQSKVVQGYNKEALKKELKQHQEEEMEHASLLSTRIIELGGTPEIRPMDWNKLAGCQFIPSTNLDQIAIADNAIQGEYCAIQRYNKILAFTETRDGTTSDLIRKIIRDEEEHIQDLIKIKEISSGKIETKDQKIGSLRTLEN